MKPIHTHSFGGVKFEIEEMTSIDGLCDLEAQCISILRGNTIEALSSLLEEGMHAMRIPDKYLHKSDGDVRIGQSVSKVNDLARLAWRLGWRRTG